MRSVVSQFEVEFLHDNQLHSLNVPLRELTAIALYQHLQQRLESLEKKNFQT